MDDATTTASDLLTETRATLARLRGTSDVPVGAIRGDVAKVLEERGVIVRDLVFHGYWHRPESKVGVCADAQGFEI